MEYAEPPPEQPPQPQDQETQANYAPAYQDTHAPSLIKWQLDPTTIIDDIEHKLRGEVWSDEKGAWVQNRNKLMNENGVNYFMAQIEFRLSRIFILSDLDEQDIENIARGFAEDIIWDIVKNFKKYGILKSNAATIANLLIDSVYVTLCRAKKGGERNFLKSAEKILESHTNAPRRRGGVIESFTKAMKI